MYYLQDYIFIKKQLLSKETNSEYICNSDNGSASCSGMPTGRLHTLGGKRSTFRLGIEHILLDYNIPKLSNMSKSTDTAIRYNTDSLTDAKTEKRFGVIVCVKHTD